MDELKEILAGLQQPQETTKVIAPPKPGFRHAYPTGTRSSTPPTTKLKRLEEMQPHEIAQLSSKERKKVVDDARAREVARITNSGGGTGGF